MIPARIREAAIAGSDQSVPMLKQRAVMTAITDTAVNHGWPATFRLALLIGAVQVNRAAAVLGGVLLWAHMGQ